jgi:hypothetical protein
MKLIVTDKMVVKSIITVPVIKWNEVHDKMRRIILEMLVIIHSENYYHLILKNPRDQDVHSNNCVGCFDACEM